MRLQEAAPGLKRMVAVSLVCGLGSAGLLEAGTTSAAEGNELVRITRPDNSSFQGDLIPIANVGSGYVIGNAYDNNTVHIDRRGESGDYVSGLIAGRLCGSIETAVLSSSAISPLGNACDSLLEELKDRDSFGQDFNCPEELHEDPSKSSCVGGSFALQPTPKCTDYKRLVYSRYYGVKRDPETGEYKLVVIGFKKKYLMGKLAAGAALSYRYTTTDGRAAMSRFTNLEPMGARGASRGWGFIRELCVPQKGRYTGHRKTEETPPGANPVEDAG